MKNEEFTAYLQHYYKSANICPAEEKRMLSAALGDARGLAVYLRDVQFTPYLLQEFIIRHWSVAVSAKSRDAFDVALLILDEISKLPTSLKYQTLLSLFDVGMPPIAAMRKICLSLEQKRGRNNDEK